MGVVHDALRRDLVRVRDVVTAEPHPHGRQRQALGSHVVWLMEFLHAHHTSEDLGLWPLVRERNPAAGQLLDSLEAEHRTISPAIEWLTEAGRSYASTTDDEARVALAAALDGLTSVLFPHLDREVADAMPVVSASITHADWRAIEQRYNIKPKSLAQLGIEGQWLLDGIDPEGRQVVLQTVPFIPRLLLLYGFARPYGRQARARWQPDVAGERSVRR
ncbi:MAG TPA: hemerythrin domain-containing protein [Micromonosporaceae bacterium]